MAYEVLARKWRPRQFADVIGQEHVTRTLSNAIASGRVAHAYLFIGPRGIGKTTLARIFAKALNCEKGPTVAPCDECEHCRLIMGGNALDVMELDGASHNKVEHIHPILDSIHFAPAAGRFKIIIIDECHMLTPSAWNALLKTLEEPPSFVKFIFATTEGDKLLPTIISRCQRFDLRRIPSTLIASQLEKIAAAEKIPIEKDALLAIARGAEGGMRDALSALDQLAAFTDGTIAESDVLGIFGLVSRESLENLAAHILRGDAASALRLVDELYQSGKDLRRLVAELLNHFRNLLVCQYVGAAGSASLDVTPEQEKVLREQSALASSEGVLRVAEHLADADGRMRYALSGRVLLETALVRCCRAAVTISLDEVLRRLKALRTEAPATAPAARAESGGAPQAAVPPVAIPIPPVATPAPAAPAPSSPSSSSSADDPSLFRDPVLKQALSSLDGRVIGVE